jgi:hypothetical protein
MPDIAHTQRDSFDPDRVRSSLRWSPEEQTQARQALAEQMQQREPAIRMPMSSFKQALADGEFKNQFETGKSQAASGKKSYYADLRMGIEQDYLGTPKDAGVRPVYGYMAPSRADFLSADNPADVQSAIKYLPMGIGQATAVMSAPDDYVLAIAPSRFNAGEGTYADVENKETLAARNAVGNESLQRMFAGTAYYPLGDGHGNINEATAVAYANGEYSANQYGDVQVQFGRQTLGTSTVTGGDSIDGRLMGIPAGMAASGDERTPIGMAAHRTSYDENFGKAAGYIETQFHDHPTVDDISKVFFTGGKPTGAVTKELEVKGIAWEYAPMPKLSSMKQSLSDTIGGINLSDKTPDEVYALTHWPKR